MHRPARRKAGRRPVCSDDACGSIPHPSGIDTSALDRASSPTQWQPPKRSRVNPQMVTAAVQTDDFGDSSDIILLPATNNTQQFIPQQAGSSRMANSARRTAPATVTSGALPAGYGLPQTSSAAALPTTVGPANIVTLAANDIPRIQLNSRPSANKKTHRSHKTSGTVGALDLPADIDMVQGNVQASAAQGFVPHELPPIDSSSDSESPDSEAEEDIPSSFTAAIKAHTSSLLGGGNAVPFQQPISAPIPTQVPTSLKKQIWKNQLVDLAQLLPTDPLSRPQLGGFRFQVDKYGNLTLAPNQKPKQILSIEAWTTAFLRFVSIYSAKYPTETQSLMKYMEIIRDLSVKCPGPTFLLYDIQFRTLRETARMPWDRIHMESWLLSTTQPVPWLEQQFFRANRSSSNKRPQAPRQRFLKNTCFAFNRGTLCRNQPCPFPHVCGFCRGNHCATNCSPQGQRGPNSKPPSSSGSQNPHPTSKPPRR